MGEYTYNIFGSADSRDLDVAVVVPDAIDAVSLKSHELTLLEQQIAQNITKARENAGLKQLPVDVTLVLLNEAGNIRWTSKGTPTKTNNVILHTYALHTQQHACIIKSSVVRRRLDELVQLGGAIQRSVTNAYFKQLPHSKDLNFLGRQIEKLRHTVLTPSIIRGGIAADLLPHKRCKALAFQIAITHSLFLHNKEIFTKQDVYEAYPEISSFFVDEPDAADASFYALNQLLQDIADWASDHREELRIERHAEPLGF